MRQAYDCGRVALGKEPCKIVADGTLGCKDEDELLDLFRMMASGDREAYMQAATVSLATQQCDVFTRGTEVFVEDTKVFSDTAYIRPKGQVSKYWVSRLALWDREES
ncbi:MAG: hypothetical protein F4X36_14880 [Gammaproteobacteria bacterium]|nr:hypothetical protein [Gammaproteobacteria bacterium]